jgi:hypothetical protein
MDGKAEADDHSGDDLPSGLFSPTSSTWYAFASASTGEGSCLTSAEFSGCSDELSPGGSGLMFVHSNGEG